MMHETYRRKKSWKNNDKGASRIVIVAAALFLYINND